MSELPVVNKNSSKSSSSNFIENVLSLVSVAGLLGLLSYTSVPSNWSVAGWNNWCDGATLLTNFQPSPTLSGVINGFVTSVAIALFGIFVLTNISKLPLILFSIFQSIFSPSANSISKSLS